MESSFFAVSDFTEGISLIAIVLDHWQGVLSCCIAK
jgi:hypothetical protein